MIWRLLAVCVGALTIGCMSAEPGDQFPPDMGFPRFPIDLSVFVQGDLSGIGGPGSRGCRENSDCLGDYCLPPRVSIYCVRLNLHQGNPAPTCSTATECQAGEVCTTLPCAAATAQKYCLPHCTTDADCPIDYACDATSRSCVTSPATCNGSICPGPFYMCNGGGPYTCAGTSCTGDNDCGAVDGGVCVAQSCAPTTGTCTAL